MKSSPAFIDMREEVLALIHASPGPTMASDLRGTAPPTVRAVTRASPGEGSSVVISVVTVVLLALWWRWLPISAGSGICFCHAEKIFSAFVSASKATFNGKAARALRGA